MSEPEIDEPRERTIQAVRASEHPLNAAEILERISSHSRVSQAQLAAILAAASDSGDVHVWPPYLSRAPRYWARRPEDHAEIRVLELLAEKSLTLSELVRGTARDLTGYSAAKRGALIRTAAAGLKKRGSLYEYPRLGRTGPKYSRKPAEAGPYLCAMKKEFNALVEKLRSAGIGPEQIIAELRNDVPAVAPAALPAAADLEQRILDRLKGRPGGLSLKDLRTSVQFPEGPKDVFDRAVLSLYRSQRVYLDRHDRPTVLSDSERQELVSDGAGSYYTGITLRGGSGQSIS